MHRPEFVLSWKNIEVGVMEKNQKFWRSREYRKMILKKASGYMKSGSLVAIMGSSGAGKTTLLATLSGRNKGRHGKVLINNKEVSPQSMKNQSEYLYQDCIFVESLTVAEHMKFMAVLKLGCAEKVKRLERCNILLQDLSLQGSSNSLLKFLSGGEKKRLALCVALLNDPDILFCDEPTTGLDSFNAIAVIEKLQELSHMGKLIVVTIHQPSSHLLSYFTHLTYLSSGQVVYNGRVGNGLFLLERFKLSSAINGYYQENDVQINSGYKETNGFFKPENVHRYPKSLLSRNHFGTELIWLIWRECVVWKRNTLEALVQFQFLMLSALIVSMIYKDTSITGANAEQNVNGLLTFLSIELLFSHIYSVINTFPGEFSIFLREKELYSTSPYFISKVISMIPRNFLQPSCYLAIVFIFVDMSNDGELYIDMLFVLFFACISASLLGLCISAHFNSIQYMDLFLVPFDTFSLILTGAVLKVPEMPSYISWVKYISPFPYAFESLAIIEWTHIEKYNQTSQINGYDVLNNMGYASDRSKVMWNVFYLTVFSFCSCITGYIGLIKKKNKYQSY